MDSTNHSMKFISYNIQSFGKDKYCTVRDLLNKCDFLLIQEAWKYENDFINIIKKDFLGFECYFTSEMDEKVTRVGRPFGGTGILYKTNNKCNVEKISTHSKKMCTVKISSENTSLILFNIYMPVDTGRQGRELMEFNEILDEIKTIVADYAPQNVVLGGDFNADMARNNFQSVALNSFVSNENLFLCLNSNIANVPYTRDQNQTTSTIDHFIVSNNLSSKLCKYETLFIHNNFSDHLPLLIEMELELVYIEIPKVNLSSKTKWNECSEKNIEDYKLKIESDLLSVEFKQEALTCKDLHCNKHSEYIEYLYKSIIDICSNASEMHLPTSSNGNKQKVIPGWNDYVQPFLDKSLFWHDIWVQNGRPRNGELARVMRASRARYHYAIKHTLKAEINIRNNKMAEAVSNNDDRNLWQEVRKMNKTNQCFANLVEGQTGPENIANLFYEKNKELFNSVGYNVDTMKNLKVKIENLVDTCSLENERISVQEVKDAVKSMKKGKKEENGLYTDHFINGPERLFIMISILFNSMIIHGIAPSDFLIGTMIPIIKDHRKSCKKFDNYRTLTLGTIMSKIFDIIILEKHNSYFNTSEMQYGFKCKSSTVMSTFMVNQTISHYLSRGSNVNVLMLDASKAFDKIDFVKLFDKLVKRGLSPIVIRLILNMYIGQKFQVKWNGVISEMFEVSNGVRQGGVMSPILFGIYIDELLSELKQKGTGCQVGHYFCGAFGYADDIVLLCPTITGLKKMIKICENYAKEHNITFNGSKSKLLVFGNSDVTPKIFINGKEVEKCNEAQYLGILLSTGDYSAATEEGTTKFNISYNRFLAKFNTCRVSVKYKLFNQYCCSYYGSQLWPLWNNKFEDICTKWRKALRNIWNLPYRAHCKMLPVIADTYPIDIALEIRFIKFFKSVINSENETVMYMANLMKNDCNSTFGHNVRHLNVKYGISLRECTEMSIKHIKRRMYIHWSHTVDDNLYQAAVMVRELSLMRDGTFSDLHNFYNETQLKELIDYLCTI